MCELVEFFFRLFLGVAVLHLEEAGEFVALPRDRRQVVVRQLAPFRLHFARELLPVACDLIPVHDEPPWKKISRNVVILFHFVAASCRSAGMEAAGVTTARRRTSRSDA